MLFPWELFFLGGGGGGFLFFFFFFFFFFFDFFRVNLLRSEAKQFWKYYLPWKYTSIVESFEEFRQTLVHEIALELRFTNRKLSLIYKEMHFISFCDLSPH